MGTEIKTWQIVNGKLSPVDTVLRDEGRTETKHLEPWIESNPELIGTDIVIIGRQVQTKSGPINLLGIDRSGNTVIVELKRDKLPRECLAQAIDYASDVAEWTVERLSEVCSTYRKKSLEEVFADAFPDDIEAANLNSTQRIVLIGFSIEAQLERMIEWLSDRYSVNVNAVVLSYVKTAGGEELLTKTTIISEDIEIERSRKQKKFEIPMSDDPGKHEPMELRKLLLDYLGRTKVTNERIRQILLPACLKTKVLSRDQLRKAFVEFDPKNYDEARAGAYITLISSQLGMTKNDFLRQVVAYEYPRHHWEKDNFSIREEHRDLVKEVLAQLGQKL